MGYSRSVFFKNSPFLKMAITWKIDVEIDSNFLHCIRTSKTHQKTSRYSNSKFCGKPWSLHILTIGFTVSFALNKQHVQWPIKQQHTNMYTICICMCTCIPPYTCTCTCSRFFSRIIIFVNDIHVYMYMYLEVRGINYHKFLLYSAILFIPY